MKLIMLISLLSTLILVRCFDIERPQDPVKFAEKERLAETSGRPMAAQINKAPSKVTFLAGKQPRDSCKEKPPKTTFDPLVEAKAKATGPNWLAMRRGRHTDLIAIPDDHEVRRSVRDRRSARGCGAASPGKPLTVIAKGHAVTASLVLATGQATMTVRGQQGRWRETIEAPRLEYLVIKNRGRRAQEGQRPARVSIKIDGIGIAEVGAGDRYRPQDVSLLDDIATVDT